jgi:hypothetical protein
LLIDVLLFELILTEPSMTLLLDLASLLRLQAVQSCLTYVHAALRHNVEILLRFCRFLMSLKDFIYLFLSFYFLHLRIHDFCTELHIEFHIIVHIINFLHFLNIWIELASIKASEVNIGVFLYIFFLNFEALIATHFLNLLNNGVLFLLVSFNIDCLLFVLGKPMFIKFFSAHFVEVFSVAGILPWIMVFLVVFSFVFVCVPLHHVFQAV